MRIEFRFGDVLPADDAVARWIVKLGMIHNDLVFVNGRLTTAEHHSIEWFYWWRYAIAHYHEAMNCLAEERELADVAKFIQGLPEEVRALHDEALAVHREVVSFVSRVRNEATFHYPGEQARKALQRALEQLTDDIGMIEGGDDNKVRGSRMHYADDVIATLFERAMSANNHIESAVARAAEGERSLMRFINHAQDFYFLRHVESGAARAI